MGTFYGSATNAAELGGGVVGDIKQSMIDVVNSWIDANICEFGFSTDEVNETYFVNNNQDLIVLKHFPVISVDSVIFYDYDDVDLNIGIDEYELDYETGVLKIKSVHGIISNVNIIGLHLIEKITITYTYGYTTCPDIIKQIANLMMAKWIKIKSGQLDASGLKSVRVGDYSESYDIEFMNISTEFDSLLNPLIQKAKAIYAVGV
jgi:hypothetical protein